MGVKKEKMVFKFYKKYDIIRKIYFLENTEINITVKGRTE